MGGGGAADQSRPHPFLPPAPLQASWPKLGLSLLPRLLASGCNDCGGVLMKETITRAAGGAHGASVSASDLAAAAVAAGRVPVQRTTLYGRVEAPVRA